jgi:glycosyltransferase involved in cell wall biosynthesis
MDNPSVALIGHEYPPYHIGGVGSYTYELARFLSRRKVATTVFCGKSANVSEEQVNDYLKIVRLPLLDVPLRAYWFQAQNWRFLRRAIADYEIVHIISPQSAALVALAKGKNSHLLTTVHGMPRFNAKAFFEAQVSDWTLREFLYNFFEAPIDEMLLKLCFNRSTKIVFVGLNVLRETNAVFHGVPAEKIACIPIGIDFEKIESLKGSLGENPRKEEGCILFYGRLVWVKGIFHLIEAVAKLRRHFPDVRLRIIGRGPSLKKLRELVCKLDLNRSVDFLGHLPNHTDVIREIVRSSVVVLPSTYEAASLAVVEAMACGKPTVAFDYSFAREVIENFRTGLLAKPGDSTDLAEKIRIVLDDKGLQSMLGDNAFEHAYRHHNWESLVNSYIELYREVAEY